MRLFPLPTTGGRMPVRSIARPVAIAFLGLSFLAAGAASSSAATGAADAVAVPATQCNNDPGFDPSNDPRNRTCNPTLHWGYDAPNAGPPPAATKAPHPPKK